MKNVKDLKKCRICHSSKLYKFLDLGSMPIPNGFLKKEDLKNPEERFELACFFCENCGLVQLTNIVNPNIMFRNYVYIPSTSKVMMNNFSNLAYHAHQHVGLNEKKLAVDIGSNDGSLLTFFKSFGTRVLGIDPARNLAKVAELNGVPTMVKLFGAKTAEEAEGKHGKAHVITATNVIAHIDDLHSVFQGVSRFLADDGVFITEFPYLLDLMIKNEFDTIYHEHLSYFSLKPWNKIVEDYGFEIINAQRLLIQGGSIRLTHRKRKNKSNPFRKTVEYLVGLEERHGLYDIKAYDRFATRIENLKSDLQILIKDLLKQKKTIVGYGAAAKGNVLTHYFDLGKESLKYIVDSTPYKQGLFTPGKHIPVHPEARLLKDMPDYALILAWNFANEIIEKQKEYRKKGGKFIVPIPKVKIV